MAQVRKYAALPDLDESQDVFETPELTDDASTLQSTTARSPSPTASETSDTEANSSISRSKLQPGQARTQFVSSRVDAREADFSDRLSSKRRAYHVSSRRRHHDDGDEDDDDWDSEDEDESLARKVARLGREMQEVQSELDKRAEEANDTSEPDKDHQVSAKLGQLSQALDQIRLSQSAHARLTRQLTNKPPQQPHLQAPDSTSRPTSSPDAPDTQALNKVTDFDARLASLERQLGITSLDTPQTTTTNPTPILSTLDLLDRQLALLTSSPSQPHLDALVQKLQQQQQQQATPGNSETAPLSPEDMAKLRSLYALLPTLTSLAPTLPPLLARLRSLRTLHANAATASQMLDEVERRQDEADKEIREWRDGLKKVQDAVTNAEGSMRDNATAVEGWVKDLEERLKTLG